MSQFTAFDTDRDGFLEANDVKTIFLHSGLDKKSLGSIWLLCDSTRRSKLNREEFVLGMYLIEQTLRGVPIPQTLPPDLIPPSTRNYPGK